MFGFVWTHTHTHRLSHTAVSRDEGPKKAAKLPAKVWKERRAQWRERGTTFEKGL